jgi:hypothetical protein
MGASHETSGLPCQDAHVVHQLPGGWLLIAVADGAGSAAHADLGAHTACRAACAQLMGDGLDQTAEPPAVDDALVFAMGAAADALRRVAEQQGLLPRDLACTLILVLAGPTGTAVAHLGDGAVVAKRHDVTGVLSWPQQGAYANETDFLTDDNGLARVRYAGDLPAVDALAVFTDGLQHLLLDYATQTAHLPFFDRMLTGLSDQPMGNSDPRDAALARYLSSDALRNRADDDLTLVLAARGPV